MKGIENRDFPSDKLSRLPSQLNGLDQFDSTESEDELKDHLFHEFVKQALVEDFFDELGEYFDPQELDEFQKYISQYSDEEIISALALPRELRQKNFERFAALIQNGIAIEDIVREYVALTASRKFGIGFHTSPNDFRPKENGSWTIKGTEKDHRDDDRVMAYYSSQYRHLFKKNGSRFIYVVRTDPDHKTDQNWSRADSLSVIMRIPLENAINYVESTVRQKKSPTVESVGD